MSEMKPRVVWVAEYDDDSDYLSVMERLDTQGKHEGVTICRLHGEASADLIAEAGTVFHNTGLSPVQLVEMVKELQSVTRRLMRSFPTDSDMEEAGWEQCEIDEACNAHDAARAALAKCEGVKP